MVSSVEQLVRYVKCRGSRVGGRRFFMCLRISLSKHFLMVGMSAMGRWLLRQDTGVFLGAGIMAVVLKHDGKVALLREMLKMSVRTSASWSAHPLSTLLGMLSGPAALCWLTLCRIFLTSALVRRSTCSPNKLMKLVSVKPGYIHLMSYKLHVSFTDVCSERTHLSCLSFYCSAIRTLCVQCPVS